MPPKKQEASKKTVDKKKAKIVEDKTFGLKNKNKSKTVQKFIKGVESQVGKTGKGTKTFEEKEREKKNEEAKKLEESLFKPVVQQTKAPVGVDPKSVVCEFFRKGMCSKGDKCKYSHDLEVERKTAKIDIYTDRRDAEKKEDETMENWDQLKLETVVSTKHGTESKTNRTKIVCKYFLEAIEQKKYGWFWVCPNGGDSCMYVHALPPGFVLKTQKKEEDEDVETQPIEEIIEEARSKLTTRTPITLEIFLKWREDKKKKKEEAEKTSREKRDTEVKSGRAMRSGRELFEFNADLFVDEDDVLDTEELEPEERDEDEGPVRYIEATGTSINLTITNNGEEQVNEELFTDENIPDDEDE